MDRREFVQLLWAGAVLSAVSDVAQAGTPPDAPDLSTPEAAVKSFIAAFNRGDAANLAMCVLGATASEAIPELIRTPMKFAVAETTTYYADAKDRAAVEISVTAEAAQGERGAAFTQTEFVPLRKEGTAWKIVPLDIAVMTDAARRGTSVSVVQSLATMVRNPDVLLAARKRAREITALSNAKQLGLGLVMYSQDYDEKFPPSAAKFKADLLPYVKDATIFTSPLDPAGTESFKLNPQMAGKSLAVIGEPANTVLFYEGEYKKPLYRYDGKAIIGFADGRAKMMTPAEVAKLRWSW